MQLEHILVELQTASSSFVKQLLPSATTCTLRYNKASTASITVRDSDPAVPALIAPGARATVWLITLDEGLLTQRRLVEGRVGQIESAGPYGNLTASVVDDFSWFTSMLAWQKPDAAVTAQTSEFATYTGPAETRALAVIAAAVDRLNLPVDVPASEGRGPVGVSRFRMDQVATVVDMLTDARLQLTIERNRETGRWVVEIRTGAVYTRALTALSGVISSWRIARQPATATRVVVGGAGQGVAREYKTVINSALEAELGRVLEVYVDASDAEPGADLTPYGLEALAANAEKGSVAAELRETSWFRYPTSYDLGTRVPVQVGPAAIHDIVSEITVAHTNEAGFTVTPRFGFADMEPQTRLTKYVASIAKSVRSLERR
ncbi:hypothetical protein [Microbacterium sp. 77mftsu3.1]|uniref:Gp37-like protein n=1 Tax=Microbacterium sp. 77mftsu3.1 TaxID=1761802 RepID=UPI0003785CB0|nr:hypothetical protein [Microbacterium sp. 77mftsu3.1]SDG21408.1 virus ReqiPepy6 Gp37-like protein [Microbacterium sp. 77mftsu3.1]